MCTGSWSCIQALCVPAVAATSNEMSKDNNKLHGHDHAYVVYVHPQPMIKRTSMSSALMSDKSLEMCTENLGSESGSDMILTDSTGIDMILCSARRRPRMMNYNLNSRASANLFPPPLSTISGSNSIRISSRRESGRLVMEACSAPPRHSYIHAERSGGRLRLSLIIRDSGSDCEDGTADQDREQLDHDQLEEENEDQCRREDDDAIMSSGDKAEQIEIGEENVNIAEEEEEEYHSDHHMYAMSCMDGIRWKIGSRCNEISGGRSNRIFINWESFWVATS